jgi:type I restriction enzyme M protein
MAIKKSQLYSSLWKSCDELRGGMDASQYKDYVLTILFVKYVSDRFDVDEDALIEVPEGASFKDLVKLKDKPTIGDDINKKVIAPLAKEAGIDIKADFNDDSKLGKGKDMVDRLTNLIAIFEKPELDFKKNGAEGDDILGDAYEFLMKHFASESGKSKGQFYTPAEVSRILAKVISIDKAEKQDQTIYDPTCGSGSLLLKAIGESPKGLTPYGQEMDNATATLAKMNMVIHGVEFAEIWQDNTLSKPHTWDETKNPLKTFDFVVANPPFSNKSWSNGVDTDNDEYGRFEGFGVPPAKNGDYAFLLHIIKSLKSAGKGAIILPHGVLFRGNAEAEIRKNVIKRGYIKGIIGLPANLFFGTGIPACIIVVDKENAESRKGIFMIDASKGFFKDGNKNRLRAQDIHKIVDVFNKQIVVPKYSRMVDLAEIEKNEFNLNIPRYIDSQEEEDVQDIDAHLLGGIPNKDIEALNKYWAAYPNMRSVLFNANNREGYSSLNVDVNEINPIIFEHDDFKSFTKRIEDIFQKWCDKHQEKLKNLEMGFNPNELIFDLSEDLLSVFFELKLIDKYDMYQHLMEYWAETMQDDAYILSTDGWKAEVYRILETNKKGKEVDKGWTCDLIPKQLVIDRYFIEEFNAINKLKEELENATQKIQTIDEENSGDDDVFIEIRNDKGNITVGNLKKKIKELKKDPDMQEELVILEKYQFFKDEEKRLKKAIKDLEGMLDDELLAKYPTLSVDEIKQLVVDDKWITELHKRVTSELDRVSQKLTGRIKELSIRYENPMPELTKAVQNLTSKVDSHLEKMGFKW